MIKIKDMQCGNDNVEFMALITYVTCGKTNGAHKSNYLSITFQDDSGQIDAKLWNATSKQIDELVIGSVVRGVGDIIKYSDSRQMKIVSIDSVSHDEQQQVEFLKKAPMAQDDMQQQLQSYIKKISNMKLYAITSYLFEKYFEKFLIYPAASKNHHEYVSGLAYHTLSMLKVGDALVHIYPELNADLIYAGILMHDLGKIVELSGPAVPTYTLEGKLLGHISIGQSMINDAAKELQIEGEEVILLQHLVLSHHGKYEYGSPVLPQIREAEIINYIDNIDARMNMFGKILEEVDFGDYSKRVFALENRTIYKPYLYKK